MHHERRAYLLPPYAAQNHLAALIWLRAFTGCGLGKEEWRPLVGMLCFRNQATIWVKSHIASVGLPLTPASVQQAEGRDGLSDSTEHWVWSLLHPLPGSS